MIMKTILLAGIVIVLIGTIIFYLIRERKKGRKCVGCPYAKQCGSHGHCNGASSRG